MAHNRLICAPDPNPPVDAAMPSLDLSITATLPEDAETAVLAGRVWRPDLGGPAVVTLRDGQVIDVTIVRKPAAPEANGVDDEPPPPPHSNDRPFGNLDPASAAAAASRPGTRPRPR